VNTTSGLISGTPTAAGTSSVSLSATNAKGTGTATLALTITVPAPVITSATTASGTVGSAFSYQITASNSPTSYAATGLPAGVSVNTTSGLISGTPTTAGTSSISLSATNSTGTGTATLALTISVPAPVITSATTASGTVGSAFSYQITASNSPTSYAATGLPAGLSVNTTSGLISGTPTAAGTSSISLSATNAKGTGTATLALTISVSAPVITCGATANGTVSSAFSYQITASNSPTSYGATGLPAGLSVNTTSGLISGTPTTAGTSSVSLSATNSAGTGTASMQVTISPAATPITHVQTTAKAASKNAKSLSVAFANKTSAGDVILVGFDFSSGAVPSSISDSQGNTFSEVGSQLTTPGGTNTRVYYAANIKGGADTVTITLSASSSVLEVYLSEFTGVNATSPIDAQAGAAGSAAAVSSGNATTSSAGDLLYGFCISDSTCNAGSGFAALSGLDDNVVEDETAGNPGSYAATGSSNSGWTMQLVALRSASAAAPAVAPRSTSPAVTALAHAPAGASATATPQATVTSLFCAPETVAAGSTSTCELRVAPNANAMQIQMGSTSSQVKLPSVVSTRASQTNLSFQVNTDRAAKAQFATITAAAGSSTVQETIQIQASSRPVLTAPTALSLRVAREARFTVSAVDPGDLPVELTASGLPKGASFDASTGLFAWTPSASQAGSQKVTFLATNSAGKASSTEVTLTTGSGVLNLAHPTQLVCSPGAIASLKGDGFAQPGASFSDVSGGSLALGGTQVKINGESVPVLGVSDAQVTFLCPVLDPGTSLTATVETGSAASEPLTALMQQATPAIFSLDGSGQNQGAILVAESTDLAMVRNFQVAAHPAQPGDEILISSTGLGSPNQVTPQTIQVEIGGMPAEVASLSAVAGQAGVYVIQARVPALTDFSDAVPVQLQITTPDGKQVGSNQVTIAVEAAGR